MDFFSSLRPDSDRPTQVTYALFLLYAFLAISLLVYLGSSIVFFFSHTEEYSQTQFQFDLYVTAIAYLLMLFITIKIANGKNWARWLLLIGFILLLIFNTIGMGELISRDAISGIISLGQVLVTALAVALLFQRPSSIWFTTGEYHEDSAPELMLNDTSSVTTEAQPPNNTARNVKIWLIISQAISVLLLILWFLTLIAAQAAEGPWELLLAFSLLLHPVTATICSIVAWILYAKARYRLAAIVTSLPLLPFAILFSMWTYHELVKYL